ncbi:hypothetical protein FOV72_19720 [Gordonia rubripertincta]|uniref:hypothetical protein n=1 Tax=Gordonia rubripertincta TaxID=36822 RepID=UPI00117DA4C7|nr:hypothetical protein [Gordonia rubripertincta]TSD93491.1 hypothetical protein FOV72_19720 [Gordonia rubripertincta]
MNAVQPQSLRVAPSWRRGLRVWLAEHDLSIGDIAEQASTEFLARDHGATIYVPPPSGEQRVSFSVPDELHARITAMVHDTNPPPLWSHGIRSLRDFYLVALDLHIRSASCLDPQQV